MNYKKSFSLSVVTKQHDRKKEPDKKSVSLLVGAKRPDRKNGYKENTKYHTNTTQIPHKYHTNTTQIPHKYFLHPFF